MFCVITSMDDTDFLIELGFGVSLSDPDETSRKISESPR